MEQRISLLLEVDTTFMDYTILVKPHEAWEFAQLSANVGSKIDESVSRLLLMIDDEVPLSDRGADHPASDRVHHGYRIGREVGKRTLTLEIMKANFKKNWDYTDFLMAINRHAASTKALARIVDKDHELSVEFLWLE